MVGIKLRIHPIFYLFGLYYALTGKIAIFLVYTICAVVHELGHSFVASYEGYRLNKITLMPFGAVVSGNIEGLKSKDEFKIALAGPFTNLAIGLLFVAVWWIYPEAYAFTDVVAEANFSMALMNFIPVFPLDGGRVLSSMLSNSFGKEKAYKICKVSGIAFSAVLLGLFIASVFIKLNLSFLFFSAFVFFGAIDKHKDNKYVKIYSGLSEDKLRRGIPYKKQGVDKSITVKKLISVLDADAVNEIVVFSEGKPVATISQEKLIKIIEKGEIYSPIEKYMNIN